MEMEKLYKRKNINGSMVYLVKSTKIEDGVYKGITLENLEDTYCRVKPIKEVKYRSFFSDGSFFKDTSQILAKVYDTRDPSNECFEVFVDETIIDLYWCEDSSKPSTEYNIPFPTLREFLGGV